MSQIRNAISDDERLKKSHQIAMHVSNTNAYIDASNILIYMHYKSEVMTDEIIQNALLSGKHVFVPRIKNEQMEFYKIHSFEDCIPGSFGILEPQFDCTSFGEHLKFNPIKKIQDTLMILPGLAFDHTGSRLGYGGGYYDRYLQHTFSNCIKIAIAYECQLINHVPIEAFDQKLDYIITENTTLKTKERV